MENLKDKKDCLLGSFYDSVSNVCYYDRKNDEELSCEEVDELLEKGHVTIKEILNTIEISIRENFPTVV